MERELNRPFQPGSQSGLSSSAPDLDAVRAKLDALLHAADQIIDAVEHGAAEKYLQMSAQQGAQ